MNIRYLVMDFKPSGRMTYAYYPSLPEKYLGEIVRSHPVIYDDVVEVILSKGIIPVDCGYHTKTTSYTGVRKTPLPLQSFLMFYRNTYVSIFSSDPLIAEDPYPRVRA